MRAADGLRESREPPAGAGKRTPSRDPGANGARCLRRAGARSDDGGERCARCCWRDRRRRARRRRHRDAPARDVAVASAGGRAADRMAGDRIRRRHLRGDHRSSSAASRLLHLRQRDLMDGLRPHPGITTDRRGVVRAAAGARHAGGPCHRPHGDRWTAAAQPHEALLDVDPGFNPRGAMAIRVDPAGRVRLQPACRSSTRFSSSVKAVPGVESAALTIHVPMGDRPSMGWDAIPRVGSTTRSPTTRPGES